MTPNSFAYIVFLVIGALIYHPLSQKAKKPFLLLLSIWFYAIGGVKFLPLLALTVAFNFFAAQKLERTERKRGLLMLVLVLNLGALGLFKYLGFFGELLGCTGVQLSLPQLALPIGISFYTFVICGYMIDVYRGREAERNFLDFALFTTFFPAILSGPIERSKSLLPQFKQPRRATADDVRFAAERLIEGTVKKILAYKELSNMVMDVPHVSRAIKDMFKGKTENLPTPSLIVSEVCQYYGIEEQVLRSTLKNKNTAEARQVAMYLIRTMTNLSLPEIGREFDRDHTTVMHGLKKVEQTLQNSASPLNDTIRDITANVNNKL